MEEKPSKRKIVVTASVVLAASGLLAWALVALFEAQNYALQNEPYAADLYDNEDLGVPVSTEDVKDLQETPPNPAPASKPGVTGGGAKK